jgi:hypothetical protein
MKTFALLLVMYAMGGLWYSTYDKSGCGPGYDWTLPCLPGAMPLEFWVASLIVIALFVIFVFPGFSEEQGKGSSLFYYLWAMLAGFVVYKLVSISALVLAQVGN